MHAQTLQYVEKLNPEMTRYMQCMTDIKQRWVYINKIIKSKNYSPDKRNVERICLQFRMIVELIFLANLSSHEGYYYKTLHDLAGMWRIDEIIENIEKKNPDSYPIVIRVDKNKIPGRPEADGNINVY